MRNETRFLTGPERLDYYTIPEALTGCWICWAPVRQRGYGAFQVDGRTWYAHRYAYVLHNGPIPEDKPIICHRCDNRACVNPDHLFAGTHQDNMDDMVRKKRPRKPHGMRGETHGASRLTAEEVYAIRADKRLQSEIAASYGIGQQNVSAIKRGISWGHLP